MSRRNGAFSPARGDWHRRDTIGGQPVPQTTKFARLDDFVCGGYAFC